MSLHILLAGHGKMARAMQVVCTAHQVQLWPFDNVWTSYKHPPYEGDPSQPPPTETVAVHFGSGKQLLDLIEFCEKVGIPIIQGSTKVEIPEDRSVVIINAPNLSLPMIRFLGAFQKFAEAIGIGMEVGIVESHQRQKADTSGTARAVATTLKISELMIKSVRDRDVQLSLGVPEEYLDGHAYHDFVFTGQGVEIKVSTRIRGRQTYAEGALVLARSMVAQRKTDQIAIGPESLTIGTYDLKDVLHLLPQK